MIDLSPELLRALVLRAFVGGVLLGLFYDVLRVFRMIFGVEYFTCNRDVSIVRKIVVYAVVFVTDLIFWISVALFSIAILYTVGGGRFRGMVYPLMAVGFLLYYLTLGRLVLKVNCAVISFLKKLVFRIIKLLFCFLKFILRPVISLYHLTIGRIIGKIKEAAVIRKNEKNHVETTDNVAGIIVDCGGKEDFVYVDGRKGYRKEGRISFGSLDRQHRV